jgi:hypothetical protein
MSLNPSTNICHKGNWRNAMKRSCVPGWPSTAYDSAAAAQFLLGGGASPSSVKAVPAGWFCRSNHRSNPLGDL